MTGFRLGGRTLFLGLFLLLASAAWAYQAYAIWPVERCEKRGAWWDAQDRQCLTPMPIWRITGRLTAPGGSSDSRPVATEHRRQP
jgi:hypothetical protein